MEGVTADFQRNGFRQDGEPQHQSGTVNKSLSDCPKGVRLLSSKQVTTLQKHTLNA